MPDLTREFARFCGIGQQRKGYKPCRLVIVEGLMEGFLLLVSMILLIGVWSVSLNSRFGFPALIGFVAIGAVLGPGGLNITHGFSPVMTKSLSYIALILILFEGGLHTSIQSIRSALLPAFSLATVGVLISAVIMGGLVYTLFHVPIHSAALVGVSVSSTDAASVFAVLGGLTLRRRIVDVLEVESGTNDPMAFFLTSLLLDWTHHQAPFWHATWYVLGSFILQMAVGAVIGTGIGYIGSQMNRRIKLDTEGLYPTLSLAFALLSFSVTQLLYGSGFLAVYLTSIVMGNQGLQYRYSIMRFHEGIAWTMHILMFVVLGLLLFPSRLGAVLLPGLLLAAVGLFVARPLAVWIATMGMGFSWREKNFLAWAGMRGAVPVVLILTAVIDQVPQYDLLLDVVFFVVLSSTIVQGLTAGAFAHKLDLTEPSPSESLMDLIAIAREHAVVLPVEVAKHSRLIHHRMVDIAFPANTLCYGVIRSEKVVVPRGGTRIQSGDHLLILTDRRHIDDLKRLFHEEILGEAALLP